MSIEHKRLSYLKIVFHNSYQYLFECFSRPNLFITLNVLSEIKSQHILLLNRFDLRTNNSLFFLVIFRLAFTYLIGKCKIARTL